MKLDYQVRKGGLTAHGKAVRVWVVMKGNTVVGIYPTKGAAIQDAKLFNSKGGKA